MRCVRAFADCAHAVERGNAERRGEVAIGSAAGGGFLEFEAKFASEEVRFAEEPHGSAAALHGRAIDLACDDKGAARIGGPERGKFARDARGVGEARNAHVNIGLRIGGNHVALGAAGGHAHAYREPALEVGPAADGFNGACQLAESVCAFFKVDAGVGGDAFDLNVPVADALARGFVG